ncbi:hypothetical protein Adeg_2159 (plasmid) [Ammonifex degensii KC4]|uniref:Uncharacterized protein n=1 Tax=Ammonifex degensii (strain DSM 10501 / KC4) TaxID=429009 RepID=C9RDG5_AMMDK|nr:hypothetical protein Adeg_2159 [Ammonifex degensii KC4]
MAGLLCEVLDRLSRTEGLLREVLAELRGRGESSRRPSSGTSDKLLTAPINVFYSGKPR